MVSIHTHMHMDMDMDMVLFVMHLDIDTKRLHTLLPKGRAYSFGLWHQGHVVSGGIVAELALLLEL